MLVKVTGDIKIEELTIKKVQYLPINLHTITCVRK